MTNSSRAITSLLDPITANGYLGLRRLWSWPGRGSPSLFTRATDLSEVLGNPLTLPDVSKPTAIVYVDGFNLYRRALKGTPYKWLDLLALSSALLYEYDVILVRYFTAHISPMPNDLSQGQRQQAYLRALTVNHKIKIHLGKFRSDARLMPLHPWEFNVDGRPKTVKVKKTEEKGSDVNLATYFLFDIFTKKADVFVILTNDSDLAEPLRLAKDELGQTVGLILPTDTPSSELLKVDPQIIRQIRQGALTISQLPKDLYDRHGTITKPESW